MSVHHSSTDVLPQLLIFTQPTGDSSCRSFHSPHCHLAQTALQAGGDFHSTQEHISHLRKKNVGIEKTIYSHTPPSLQKNKREMKKPKPFTDTFPEYSNESFTEESKISHCERLTCLLEDLRIFCISIYKCSYKILAQMLQICVHVCVSVLWCHCGGKIWLSYDNGWGAAENMRQPDNLTTEVCVFYF